MEAANVDAVEDASFLAECDALEGAAACKKKLDRLIAEKQKEIREAKKSRGRGGDEFTGGRMSKEKQDEENKRQAELSRLQDGLLPGEQNRPPPPSNRDLLASAAAHSTDHAGGVRGRHQGRGAIGILLPPFSGTIHTCRFVRRLMRHVCPAPLLIMRELRDVCGVFSQMTRPVTKRPFFSSGWRGIVQSSEAPRIRCPGPPVGQPTPTILPHNRCSAKWPRHLPVPPHI